MTLGERLRDTAQRLSSVSDDARIEAEILVGHVLGLSRTALVTHRDERVNWPPQADQLIKRRALGEPLAYVTGTRGFWTLDLEVGPDVLVPRPDTETLVEASLDQLQSRPAAADEWVVDLGTGSGCIALAIASERPDLRVVATDVSRAALGVARKNADRLQLGRVKFMPGDWFDALSAEAKGRCALVASNPPYIREGDPHLRDLLHEPRSALVSGRDGLDSIRRIVGEAPAWLGSRGWLVLEHGFDQGANVRGLMSERGFVDVQTRRDLAGHERVTIGAHP